MDHGGLVVAPDPIKIDAHGTLTTDAPEHNGPTLGWSSHHWKAKHGPKQPCAKCRRGVRSGVQRYNRKGPGQPILCHRCYGEIMSDPGPGGWAGEGLN